MSPEDIRILFDYNAWADRRALESAESLRLLPCVTGEFR